jgi:hypothetical protein
MPSQDLFTSRWESGFHSDYRTMYYSDNGRPCHHCSGCTCYSYSVRVTGSESMDSNVYARCAGCHRVHAFPFTLRYVVPLQPRHVGGQDDLHARDLSALHRSPNLLVIDSERAA